MKILFTSDLHGDEEAFKSFANLLKDYDLGIISGDLMEASIPLKELSRMFGVEKEAMVPQKLPNEDFESFVKRSLSETFSPTSYLMRGLHKIEDRLKDILNSAQKPVLVIRGNNDKTEWKSSGMVYNIHMKKVTIGSLKMVGYKSLNTGFSPSEKAQLKEVSKHIDEDTIFVTHFGPENRSISEAVEQGKPKYHLHGHIHFSFGRRGRSINGSYPRHKQFIMIDTDKNKVYRLRNSTFSKDKENANTNR